MDQEITNPICIFSCTGANVLVVSQPYPSTQSPHPSPVHLHWLWQDKLVLTFKLWSIQMDGSSITYNLSVGCFANGTTKELLLFLQCLVCKVFIRWLSDKASLLWALANMLVSCVRSFKLMHLLHLITKHTYVTDLRCWALQKHWQRPSQVLCAR